jgi:hypothetical protein
MRGPAAVHQARLQVLSIILPPGLAALCLPRVTSNVRALSMNLRIAIAGIHKTYADAVLLLSAYVRDIDEAIKKIQADHDTLVKKLVAVRSGQPDLTPPSPGQKLIQLELSEEQTDLIIDVMKLAQSHAGAYPGLALRMSFVYLVALFDAFLTDAFEAVIHQRPEMLKSKKQISYEKLLEFSSLDSLIEYLAKREMNELSYKSIKEQAEHYRDRFGVSLEESGVSLPVLVELRAARNLLVHSNGVVNHIYLEQVAATPYALGESIVVERTYFDSAVRSLNKVAAHVANSLVAKHEK